ncbi:tripartite tricarboxylate transporter substrate binding protein [Variovorax sp. J22R133]|uniref:Bug family tripartite tricarboxylate transporter substrate binding protein n=1 Tax=Variovorax brevis TaxID=3053503 RepID=UPI0025762E57|nr:tripartite tricarboxylate transporter substrate binding protein [Variovorax sp. J22R133]MDM0113402.1 tripartite tricarboxylate transporter substrate binding protein [Variovorax sp. J22R133]
MSLNISRRAFAASALAAAALVSAGANAQTIPKTIRLIVAYPTGGVSDVIARMLAEKLSAQLATTVVVENRAGASGTIGMDAVAKAPADGSVIGFSAISPLVLSPHLTKSPFDPEKDIAPVASVMYSPVLILATSASGTKDFRSLMRDADASPGAIRWATSGQASLGHIMLEQLRVGAKVDITHVPYKGGGQQMNDALGGQFEILSTNASPAVASHIKSGRLRPLAVGAPKRLESLPQVPTLAELGYKAANMSSQFGVFAPAATPEVLIIKYNVEINKALASPDLRARLLATDNVPTGGTPDDFEREIVQEFENNGRIIRASGIKAE